jgi:hypothetical protein
MKRLWVLLLAGIALTGCNRSGSSSSKPSGAHAASGATLSADDQSWDVSAHLQPTAVRQRVSRTVYPFSLVAGGVYSAGDLARAIAVSDSLRAHYKNFDFKHVRLIRIQNNTPAFVSYRKDGKIFWTKRKIALHSGELVLADGHYLVRARCANQISFAPQTPIDPTPSDVEGRLDVPTVPTRLDNPRLREVNSPLFPPMQVAPPTSLLAKTYMPAGSVPMLRMTPVCTHCTGSRQQVPNPSNPQPPHQSVPVPMPDTDGLMLVIVALLLMASLLILKTQKRT